MTNCIWWLLPAVLVALFAGVRIVARWLEARRVSREYGDDPYLGGSPDLGPVEEEE